MQFSDMAKIVPKVGNCESGQGRSRIRRDTPDCVTLYNQGKALIKWLSNGDVVVHARGRSLASSDVLRLTEYLSKHPFRFRQGTTELLRVTTPSGEDFQCGSIRVFSNNSYRKD